MTDLKKDCDNETLNQHIGDAAVAAFKTMKRHARKHDLHFWTIFVNATGRLTRQIAASCDDAEEYEKVLRFLIESYAQGGQHAGFGLSGFIRRDMQDPSTMAGLH